jgi:hypothetical protein
MPTPYLTPALLPPTFVRGIYSHQGFRVENNQARDAIIAATETLLTFATTDSVLTFRERFVDAWSSLHDSNVRRQMIAIAAMIAGDCYCDKWSDASQTSESLCDATLQIVSALLTTHFGGFDVDVAVGNDFSRAIRKSQNHYREFDTTCGSYRLAERFLKITDRVSMEVGNSCQDRGFVNASPDHLQFGEGLRWYTAVVFRVGDRTVRVDCFGNCQIAEGDYRVFNLRSVNMAVESIASVVAVLMALNAPSMTSRALANYCAANCGRSFLGGIMTTPGSRRCGITVRHWRRMYRYSLPFARFTAFAANFPRPVRNWRESDARFHGNAYPVATARTIRRRARLWNWNAIPTEVAAIMARDLELHLEDPTE